MDRESAYEILKNRAAQAGTSGGGLLDTLLGGTGARGGHREGAAEAMVKSAARAIGSQVGRQLIRGVLGSLLGGRR